jgi:hypothetical protein
MPKSSNVRKRKTAFGGKRERLGHIPKAVHLAINAREYSKIPIGSFGKLLVERDTIGRNLIRQKGHANPVARAGRGATSGIIRMSGIPWFNIRRLLK